jgi:hypothetical protein
MHARSCTLTACMPSGAARACVRPVPMQPITMMRNSLGESEGGSGVALDADAYRASVAYWSTTAPIQ